MVSGQSREILRLNADSLRAFSGGFVDFEVRAVDPAVSGRRFEENGRAYRELVNDGFGLHAENSVV